MLTWIKLTGKERMITELRWRMRGVAFTPWAHSCRLESATGTGNRNRLSNKRQWKDEDMTLHAIINYCGKQCKDAPPKMNKQTLFSLHLLDTKN